MKSIFAVSILLCAALLGPSLAAAQGSYVSFPVQSANGIAIAGANVALCGTTQPTTVTACGGSALQQTYTDITLATPCTLNPTVLGPTYGTGCTNPSMADGLGIVRLYATANSSGSTYYYQTYGQGILVPDVEPVLFPGGGGGGGAGNPALPFNSVQGNQAGAFGAIPNSSINFSTGVVTYAGLNINPKFNITDSSGNTLNISTDSCCAGFFKMSTGLELSSSLAINGGSLNLYQNDAYMALQDSGKQMFVQAGPRTGGGVSALLATSTFTLPDLANGGTSNQSGVLLGMTGATAAASAGHCLFNTQGTSGAGLMADSTIICNQSIGFPTNTNGATWPGSGGITTLLDAVTPTANRIATLPDASGTVCVGPNCFPGPRPYIDVTNPLYGADSSGVLDSAPAFQAALNSCSAAAYPLFVPAGTYIFNSIVTVSNSCTVEAYPGTATIRKNFNANPSNNYTNPGYFLIAASNVTTDGLIFDCNSANFTGACVVAQGAMHDITVKNGKIINCDGPCFLSEATAAGGQGPNRILVQNNELISGSNSTTTGAGGTISAKDSSDGLQYINNPLIDGHLDTYAGSGTFELECGHTGAQMSNILIEGNPKIISTGNALTGGGWAVQAGSFGCLAMYGLKLVNNGFEPAGSVNGLVSIPSTYGAIVKGNHFNTNFRNLQEGGSDGVSQISPPLFTSASGAFVNTIPGSATGRTLAYLCSGTWYYTLVSYASSTTLTPATTPSCAGSAEQWDLWGYSPTFTALELGNSIGPVVSGNTFDVESAQWLAAIWGDNTSDADISDNVILGFGTGNIGTSAAATVGIGMNAGYNENGISSITQVGHIITVTTESALIGQTQSAMKIALCSPSNVCTQSGYYGYYQIQAVPTQLGTTFTVYSPSTGNSCSGGHATCGWVEYVGVNNKVHGNTIEFAKILPPATPLYGIQIKGATATSITGFNEFSNNTVNGTGPGTNEYCGSVQGASGVVDSNVLRENTCVNTQFGFNRTAGTNTLFDKNHMVNVTTLLTGNQQLNESVTWPNVGGPTQWGATVTGCSLTNQAGGGPLSGSFISGTNGACTVTISGLPTLPAANSGLSLPARTYFCSINDVGSPATGTQSASTGTGCTVSVTTSAGDIVIWEAKEF